MAVRSNPDSPDTGRRRLLRAASVGAGLAVIALAGRRSLNAFAAPEEHFEVMHSDAEWRALLAPEQYAVLRQEGTERAFSSPLDHEKRAGTFACAGCAQDLFASRTKFDSRTGWPSFYKPLPHAVAQSRDLSLGIVRDEVHCSRCGGHLGHVFDDGPPPTGLRYCMNGVALTFKPDA